MHRTFPLLLLLACLLAAAPAVAGGADLTPEQPVQRLRASAFPLAALGFWAQGTGFSLTRRSALYGLEGGAALRLDDGLRLTAGYRMLGIDLGFDSDLESMDVEPGIATPFLGLAVEF